jgi:hypothetical protein
MITNSRKVLGNLQSNRMDIINDKIGENINQNVKNKSLFTLLESCLVEMNNAMVNMRLLQEARIIEDPRYRITVPDIEEQREFNKLRSELVTKITQTKQFDFLLKSLDPSSERFFEGDKSFLDQHNLDSDRNDPGIGSNQENEGLILVNPHIVSETRTPVRRQLSQSATKKSTSRNEPIKPVPLQSTASKAAYIQIADLDKSTRVASAKKTFPEIEDLDTFAQNIKKAPQRVIQKRSYIL